MVYQIKALFRNKISFLLLIISLTLSFVSLFKIYERVNLSNEAAYLSYQDYYVAAYKDLNYERNFMEKDQADQENYLKYLEWTVDRRYKLGNFYLDSYRAHKDLIDDYRNIYLMAEMNISLDKGLGAQSLRERYGDRYLDLANGDIYDFDLDLLEEYGKNHLNYSENKSYAYPVYKACMMELDHKFYLLDNNLREIDFFTQSPWTYLADLYSKDSIKGRLLFPIFIIFATYIVSQGRQERTFNLLSSKKGKKSFAYNNYLVLAFIMILIIAFLPDLVSVFYAGIKYGFHGLNNPMYIFKDGLNSFATYENFGSPSLTLSLSDLYPLARQSQEAYYLSDLYSLELWKFLGLALLVDILRLMFFAVLGTSIGLLIKNPVLAIGFSSFFASLAIISGQVKDLAWKFNVFAFNTGWNHTLGWPRSSWLWTVLVLVLAIGLSYFIAFSIFRKRDLV